MADLRVPVFSTTPASAASQKAPARKGQIHRKPTCNIVVYQNHNWIPPAQPHRKPTVSSGTRQDNLTESPQENPPTQPHRKPNPERDRLTIRPHAQLASTASQKAHCFFGHTPGQPCKKPTREPANTASQKAQSRQGQAHMQCCLFLQNSRQHGFTESPLLFPAPAKTALQKAHMITRQHSLTESPIQRGTSSQKDHMQCCFQSCLVQPLSRGLAAPSREGLGGCNPCRKDPLAKTPGFRVSVGGARGVGMHGASRLALPRLGVRVFCRSRSSGRFGLRCGGCRALSEDFRV